MGFENPGLTITIMTTLDTLKQQAREKLEAILDEHFPKIHEEGPEKKANKRGEALFLFGEAMELVTSSYQAGVEAERERIGELEATLGVLEMSGRKTIKIEDVRYYLTKQSDV